MVGDCSARVSARSQFCLKYSYISRNMTFHRKIKRSLLLGIKFPSIGVQVEKSLTQEVRQKNDISERRSKWSPPSILSLFTTLPLCQCATCKGSSYTKNKYNLFYQKLDAEYFFNSFLKNAVFSEKTVKNCFGAHLTIFKRKEASCPKN